jgi:hypothetical protein
VRAAVKPAPVLIRALRDPSCMASMAIGEWDLLVRQARAANVLASLYYIVAGDDVLQRIPAQACEVLEWSRVVAARHAQATRFEVAELAHVLAELGLPLILLKGSAYLAAGLPPAPGRLFSDLDILVPKQRLDEVEAALMLAGWAGTMLDEYDQRYYRQWMHELPPMQHMRRQSMLDVHHAILPATAAVRPDPAKLRAAARSVPGAPGVQVLAPADMVLHSAVHLFYDGEFDKGLRDLFDIHRLLQHFAATPGFWDELPRRARELELDRPLFYALRYSNRVLGTPVPAAVQAAVASARPNRPLLALMDRLFERALMPDHASCADRFSAAARFLLYVRGNWLRMPPLLLARHLLHKAFLSPRATGKAA